MRGVPPELSDLKTLEMEGILNVQGYSLLLQDSLISSRLPPLLSVFT